MSNFPTRIWLNGGYGGWTGPVTLNTTSSTPTSKFYEINGSAGIEFRHEADGSTKIYVNPTGISSGTDLPDKVKVGNGGSLADSQTITDGNNVICWRTDFSTATMSFIVDMTSGNTSTDGNGNTVGPNKLLFSSPTWATATSSSHTVATGTAPQNYVPDSIRNIQCQKTAAYQIKWTFEEADFTFVGDIGYSVRKNGSTTDQLDYTFVSTDGGIEMVITSATQYPNSQILTGDEITLHSDTNVQTVDSDGTFSYKTAGTVLGSFTYTAIDVGYSISPTSPRCLDPVTITVSDTALFPDYENEVVLSYTLDNPLPGYPGGSSANMVSTAFGGSDTLTSTNGYSLTGNFTASYDGSSLTGLPGILRIYRKTPAPTNAQILLGTHSISLPSQHRRAHSFW